MRFGTFFVSIFLLLAANAAAPAQSVEITPRKVTYTRKNVDGEFRSRFTVTYPKVVAATPLLSQRIEEAIGYETNLLFILEDELNKSRWLDEADYEVHYNKNGILNIWLRTTGTSAGENYHSKSVVVDLKTGKRLTPADIFRNIPGLVTKLKQMQAADIKAETERIKKEEDYSAVYIAGLFKYSDFTAENLREFDVSDEGIAFYYDYGFPRLLMMIEPVGYYQLNWAEAKRFIRKTGLLGRFVR